jgi:acetoin utilization protein AcuB
MLILDWMKTNVISVTPDTSLRECRRLLKEHQISRLPVVDTDNIVVGLVSVEDVKTFSPQGFTGLEIIEMLEIMAESRAKDVMVVDPTTITYKSTVEQAAMIMRDTRVGCLPVVNDEEKLVGIVTGWDIFKALLDISGADRPGAEVGFVIPDQAGKLREILDQLRGYGMRLISVLSAAYVNETRQVKIRFFGKDAASQNAALKEFADHPGLRYWSREGEFYIKDQPKL